MDPSLQIGVIADDFTGAMDTGAPFPRCGLDTAFALAGVPPRQVIVLNTASREISPAQARERCAQAAEALRGRLLFKKIDSTLRGHIGAELEGLLSAAGGAKVLVCPAAPRQGRVVKDGLLWVNGLPLHESPFKNDPVFPARTASVAERIGISSTHLALSAVRQPVPDLAQMVAAAPTQVVTVDAVDEEDLRRISAAAVQAGCIPCGALGLASAWAQALTGRPPADPAFTLSQASAPVLIVAGSAHPSTHAQIDAFTHHPDSQICGLMVPIDPQGEALLHESLLAAWGSLRAVILAPAVRQPVRDPEWLAFAHTVSRLAVELIRHRTPACLVIAGGETANHLCRLLEVQSVRLLGEAASGVPIGRISGGLADGLILVTKAGGFGQPDCLEKIVYR